MMSNKRLFEEQQHQKPPSAGDDRKSQENGDCSSSAAALEDNKRPRLDTSQQQEEKDAALPSHHHRRRRALTAVEKRTNDDVHSTIQLDPVAVAIMDTPHFQRLRKIQQLGTSDTVYMNCNHSRFEHSLGVYHLAGNMVERISERQPQLRVTAKDRLCVALAGLLHDVGHGPFSHVYDGEFMSEVFPKYLEAHRDQVGHLYEESSLPVLPESWSHEQASLLMLDGLLEHLGLCINVDGLDEPLQEIGDLNDPELVSARSMRVFSSLHHHHTFHDSSSSSASAGQSNGNNDCILTSRDFVFIKECILGHPLPELERIGGGGGFVGRPQPHKEWLYTVVSNRHSGLDVDKVDYFARDERHAMKTSGEIDKRVIEEAFVAYGACPNRSKCFQCQQGNGNGAPSQQQQHLMICYPEKMVSAILSFFKKRFDLHKRIYRHKVVTATGFMVSDILCLADPYVWFHPIVRKAGNGNKNVGRAKREYDSLPMSRAMLDPSVFLRLNDSVLDIISYQQDPKLQPARDLIQRWDSRDFYKCVVDRSFNISNPTEERIWQMSEDDIKEGLLRVGGSHEGADGTQLKLEADDFFVQRCDIHYGSKDRNPLNNMRFLPKAKLHELRNPIDQLPVAAMIDESTYEAQLPRSFQETSIRLISRSSHKDGLLQHTFSSWLESAKFNMTANISPMGPSYPQGVSQESEDEDESSGNGLVARHSHDASFPTVPCTVSTSPCFTLTPRTAKR